MFRFISARTVHKLVSVVVLVALLVSNTSVLLSSPVFAASPSSVQNCTVTDGSDRLNVDNSISYNVGQGCLVDYSAFPSVKVRVHNNKNYWMNVDERFSAFSTITSRDNAWARLKVIPSNSYAEYTIAFSDSVNASHGFDLSALEGNGAIANLFEALLDVLGGALGTDESAISFMLDQSSNTYHLGLAFNAFKQRNAWEGANQIWQAINDEVEMAAIKAILIRFIPNITEAQIRSALIVAAVLNAEKVYLDFVIAANSGEAFAGSVWFDSKVTGDPVPPHDGGGQATLDNVTLVSQNFQSGDNVVWPGVEYWKLWHIRNDSTTTWSGYTLSFISGNMLGGQQDIQINPLDSGAELDVWMRFVPSANIQGIQSGYWQFRHGSTYFGPSMPLTRIIRWFIFLFFFLFLQFINWVDTIVYVMIYLFVFEKTC